MAAQDKRRSLLLCWHGGEISALRRTSGDGWLKRVLRYLAHFPEKGRMIIPGKKLYLHGASDADWSGEEMSMKSTTGAYLALGDYGVVWSCSKLQKSASILREQ